MPEKQPNRPDPDNRVGRLSKNAAFLMMMALMFLLAIQIMRGQGELVADFTYTEFRAHLAEGRVHKVVFRDRQLEGELTQPVLREGQEYTQFETRLPGDVTDGLLLELAERNVIVEAEATETGWGTLLLTALPWLLFIAFWIWIFRTMQGGGNRAFQFGRSKAKMISPDTPKVTFADVAGADEAKEELQEIIEFLKDPHASPARWSSAEGRAPRGPAGDRARRFSPSAVAGEAGRPFFQMSGSDFVEMFVGVGASRVRDLFEQGKAHAPCIIFVDEIDAVGGIGVPAWAGARRARADAERAPRRDGRLRVERGGHPARGDQPPGRARPGVAPARVASTGRSSWTHRT
jgi:cell division protease FtsH